MKGYLFLGWKHPELGFLADTSVQIAILDTKSPPFISLFRTFMHDKKDLLLEAPVTYKGLEDKVLKVESVEVAYIGGSDNCQRPVYHVYTSVYTNKMSQKDFNNLVGNYGQDQEVKLDKGETNEKNTGKHISTGVPKSVCPGSSGSTGKREKKTGSKKPRDSKKRSKTSQLTACTEHPTYKGIRKPKRTEKHPEGCPMCWEIYNAKNA